MKPFGGKGSPPYIKAATRDGMGFRVKDINEWVVRGGYVGILIGDPAFDRGERGNKPEGAGLMTLEQTLQNAMDETDEAYKQFDKARAKFRSEVKNDVAAIESSAKRIAAEFERITRALLVLQQTYTSGDFVAAVANAERLAAALSSIQALSSSKVTFTVIEQRPE